MGPPANHPPNASLRTALTTHDSQQTHAAEIPSHIHKSDWDCEAQHHKLTHTHPPLHQACPTFGRAAWRTWPLCREPTIVPTPGD